MQSHRPNRLLRRALTLGFVISGVALGWFARSAKAGGISSTNPLQYAGTLAEQGVPVNGTRVLEIVIWNDANASAASNKICDTSPGSTSVVQGRFTVPLDNSCVAGIQSTPDTWAEVFVSGASFGRQKIGAVPYAAISGAVNGLVTSTAILPAFNTGTATGAGLASVYNDGTTEKALVISGNNAATGTGVRAVSLHDNVSVSGTLTTPALSVSNATVNGLNVTGSLATNGHPALMFGGMYCTGGGHGGVAGINPLTNAQSCPPGFTTQELFWSGDVASCSSTCGGWTCYYCYH